MLPLQLVNILGSPSVGWIIVLLLGFLLSLLSIQQTNKVINSLNHTLAPSISNMEVVFFPLYWSKLVGPYI